jgi:hypothetical protein
MVVLYYPVYGQRDYCLREFALMEKIEARRRAAIGADAMGRQFIIPVAMVDPQEASPALTANARTVADLSAYHVLPRRRRNLKMHPMMYEQLTRISMSIRQACLLLSAHEGQVSAVIDCAQSALPAANTVPAWPMPARPFPI